METTIPITVLLLAREPLTITINELPMVMTAGDVLNLTMRVVVPEATVSAAIEAGALVVAEPVLPTVPRLEPDHPTLTPKQEEAVDAMIDLLREWGRLPRYVDDGDGHLDEVL